MTTNNGFLNEDGTPNIPLLNETFNRCAPSIAGGIQWLDDIRFCRWANQYVDGKKHDVTGNPNGKAKPWDGASDCRPYLVDDIINERVAMKTVAFWRSVIQPGAAGDEEGSYAVALLEHLIFNRLANALGREVELAAQYEEQYGWCLLAPRWRREIGLRKQSLNMEMIQQAALSAPEGDPMRQLPILIADETLEDQAVEFLRNWYDQYVAQQIPESIRDAVPKTTVSMARKVVRELRKTGKSSAALPYLCRDEPEVVALKPWDEAFVPPELTTEQEIVFQVERVGETELRGRELSEEYKSEWVEQAIKYKGAWAISQLSVGNPLGLAGNLTGGVPVPPSQPTINGGVTGPVEVIHAVYRAVDADGIPASYCTTFHRQIRVTQSGIPLYAKHELVESINDSLPYVACAREQWSRSITSSRSVAEMAHTQQNIIKGLLDGVIDRQSITLLPPVNVYESPLNTKYEFGPATQNYIRPGREPQFMQTPSGTGMADSTEVHQIVRGSVDNRFALMSPDVSPPRLQTAQEQAVRRFLLSWSKAFQQVLCLCQDKMDDAEFADITGAPVGWLESRRQQPGMFHCGLEFDVRELDPELAMKRIEAVNKIALPNDVLGTINRGDWTAYMMRAILGPSQSKRLVQSQPNASQALRDKAQVEVLKMFAGNQPNFLDKDDPTAGSLLQFTQDIVTNNPNYLRALTDEALLTLAGPQQAQAIAGAIGQRNPDQRFSGLLLKWLENLKFLGVTQPNNKMIGQIGVDPQAAGASNGNGTAYAR